MENIERVLKVIRDDKSFPGICHHFFEGGYSIEKLLPEELKQHWNKSKKRMEGISPEDFHYFTETFEFQNILQKGEKIEIVAFDSCFAFEVVSIDKTIYPKDDGYSLQGWLAINYSLKYIGKKKDLLEQLNKIVQKQKGRA